MRRRLVQGTYTLVISRADLTKGGGLSKGVPLHRASTQNSVSLIHVPYMLMYSQTSHTRTHLFWIKLQIK